MWCQDLFLWFKSVTKVFKNQSRTRTKLLSNCVLNLIKMLHGGGIATFLRFTDPVNPWYLGHENKKRKGRAVTGLISRLLRKICRIGHKFAEDKVNMIGSTEDLKWLGHECCILEREA